MKPILAVIFAVAIGSPVAMVGCTKQQEQRIFSQALSAKDAACVIAEVLLGKADPNEVQLFCSIPDNQLQAVNDLIVSTKVGMAAASKAKDGGK